MQATEKRPVVADPAQALDIADQEVRFYQNEGYLVLPGLLQPGVIEGLREEIFGLLSDHGVPRSTLERASGASDKLRQVPAYYENTLVEALIKSPRILAVAQRILGGPSTTYLPFTAVKSGGGGGQFHFHQDNQYTRHDGPSCNIWIALVDMTPQNGCLCIVPRSNHEGTLDSRVSGDGDSHRRTLEDPKDYLSVRLNAGDAVAFTRLTVHGSGPNFTDQARVAYALQYHRDDTKFLDGSDQTWKLLKSNPRWKTGASARPEKS